MARPGHQRQLRAKQPSSDTRSALIAAAIEVLKDGGHAGASARAIASRAGCNQALVFYYFGSVADLLLAALDEVSSQRFERYSSAIDAALSSQQLVDTAGRILREDLDEGYLRVLAECMAAASSIPGFGAEVLKRIKPWEQFAQRTLARLFEGSPLETIAGSEVGGRVVAALFLGLEMLAHLEDDPAKGHSDISSVVPMLPAFLAFIVTTTQPTRERSSDA